MCLKFFIKRGFQFLESLFVGGRVYLFGPHNQGVFLVIAVVTMAQSCFAEAILAVKVLRGIVGDANFEGDPLRADLIGDIDQAGQHQFSQSQAAIIGMHGNRRDMRLINHQPQAGKANNRSQVR